MMALVAETAPQQRPGERRAVDGNWLEPSPKRLKHGDRQCVYKDGSDRRVDSNRHPCFAEVPVDAAHDRQRLARYRGQQVLVGGVL